MPSKKTKLLVTTSTFWRWKGDVNPSFVYDLSKRLAKDFNVWVLAPHSGGTAISEQFDRLNISRYKYFFNRYQCLGEKAILPNLRKNPFLYLQVPFFLIAQFLAIRKIAKRYNIHLIQAHWIIPQGTIACLYKLLFNKNVKIVVTSHGGDIFGLHFWPLTALKKWTLNNTDYLTVVSSAIKDEVVSLGTKRNLSIDVVPMGVDLSLFSPENFDESIKKKYSINGPFLLFVGRLSEKKGIEYLIKAMPSILLDFPETKLLIIGLGEKEFALKSLSAQLNLTDKSIIFVGAIPNRRLPQYYATADVFVGPSIVARGGDQEGFGLVFVESIASGTFTIGTDLPAISDIIEEGKTGFIVRRKDSEQIADKIKFILSNRSELSDMRVKARQIISRKFDWDVVSEMYKQILSRVGS